jgi:hypothetical protein
MRWSRQRPARKAVERNEAEIPSVSASGETGVAANH